MKGNESESEKELRCPFCGGVLEVIYYENGNDGFPGHSEMGCYKCDWQTWIQAADEENLKKETKRILANMRIFLK